jgi:methylase of polypeptide subunit release factors
VSILRWTEDGASHSAPWRSESSIAAPRRTVVVDDTLTADAAFRLARADTGMLWRGDFVGARQLVKALDRRIARAAGRRGAEPTGFAPMRAARAERARLLARVMVLLEPDHTLDLRRAPDVRRACARAYGPGDEATCVALTELLGVISADQWQEKGVPIAQLDATIHPGYGVFSPVRGEYLDLVAEAPLDAEVAFDIGTGTGVLAALLCRRGVPRVVATDLNPRAVASARDNLTRLGYADRVEVVEADLFPAGRADLIVCNPPWVPAEPTSWLEVGIYDPEGSVLARFLAGAQDHLTPGGEVWLIISDFAEHLGLRSRADLLRQIDDAGLQVAGRLDTAPKHPRATDERDPLRAARGREVTSLWRLVRADGGDLR